ncbi:MAG TPA: alpha/beta family hydrolase [Acidobacteriaceae bacterium]|nr:alpha/beta family hydrolase [Acidobacteriaceae bacterium]
MRAGLVLTHGAGANCETPLLVALADAFSAGGVTILRCDLPFRQQLPHGPPIRTAAIDQAGLRAAASLRASLPDPEHVRIFLGGHSYGGRQATMLAAAEPGVAEALLLLSYPLHPPRKADQLRTQHFPELHTPAFFVQGARDPFGSLDEMAAGLALIPALTRLLPVESAGHELLIKTNRATLPQQIVDTFLAFLS